MHFSENELNNFYRYCVALTKNEVDAFDLLQDSLEKLIRRGTGLRSPKAYMLRIIRNCFLDSVRAEKRVPFGKSPQIVVPINEQSLEEMTANREEVQTILKDLASDDCELLYLWGVEEYSTQELAELLDCPRGTVLSRLHRLKKKIQNCLERSEGKDHGKSAEA